MIQERQLIYILKHVHKGTIETAYSIPNGDYEVIEAEIIETSELINKELKIVIYHEIRIGQYYNNEIIIPDLILYLKKKMW